VAAATTGAGERLTGCRITSSPDLNRAETIMRPDPSTATVSAIIPVYNRAHLIAAAIDSVLGQSRPVAEIIVVDDGSTDGTADVVARYGPRVHLIRQANGGPGAARNRGMKQAAGDYIAFLDSDDLWPANKNELQLDYFAHHPEVEFIFGDMANFSGDEHASEAEIKNRELHDYFATNGGGLDRLLECLITENVVPTPTVMFHRDVMTKVGWFDETLQIAEDLDYWFRVAATCRCGFINAILCHRRRHEGNLINDWVKRTQTLAVVLSRLEGMATLTPGARRALKVKLQATHYDLGSYFLKQRRFTEARQHLQRGGPSSWVDPKWMIKSGIALVGTRAGAAARFSSVEAPPRPNRLTD
jgi:glycosyltransferase involved in cell wall biosynthesis